MEIENANGEHLIQSTQINDFVIYNTCVKPKNGYRENVETWHRYGGKYSKQIDYITWLEM